MGGTTFESVVLLTMVRSTQYAMRGWRSGSPQGKPVFATHRMANGHPERWQANDSWGWAVSAVRDQTKSEYASNSVALARATFDEWLPFRRSQSRLPVDCRATPESRPFTAHLLR